MVAGCALHIAVNFPPQKKKTGSRIVVLMTAYHTRNCK